MRTASVWSISSEVSADGANDISPLIKYLTKDRGKNGLPLEDAVEECFGANTPENYEKGVRFVASLGKMGIIPSYEADRIVSQMDEIISQEG